jgi:hypothetical protein
MSPGQVAAGGPGDPGPPVTGAPVPHVSDEDRSDGAEDDRGTDALLTAAVVERPRELAVQPESPSGAGRAGVVEEGSGGGADGGGCSVADAVDDGWRVGAGPVAGLWGEPAGGLLVVVLVVFVGGDVVGFFVGGVLGERRLGGLPPVVGAHAVLLEDGLHAELVGSQFVAHG